MKYVLVHDVHKMRYQFFFKSTLVQCTTAADVKTTKLHVETVQAQIEKQRTNGPVNAHLISWPSKAQNIKNLENIW